VDGEKVAKTGRIPQGKRARKEWTLLADDSKRYYSTAIETLTHSDVSYLT